MKNFKAGIAAFVISMMGLHAEKMVIETGLPLLPSMPFIAALPEWNDEWKSRKATDVVKIWKDAVKHQHTADAVIARNWLAMHRRKDGDFYEAAVANARWGNPDLALRFLLEAARHEDFDIAEIADHESILPLAKHPRWPEIRADLDACAKIWRESRYTRVIVTLPNHHVRGGEIVIVAGLHGYGSIPEDFSGDDFQKICDECNVAFLAVSGRGVLSRNSFEWTSDVKADITHIFSQVDAIKNIAKEKIGSSVVMGFSQGGQMALQLLAMHQERIRGIVAMSPGSRYHSLMRQAIPSPSSEKLLEKTAFISWIKGEGVGMANRCHNDATWLRSHRAKVTLQEFPGEGHSWPEGYAEYFTIALRSMH